MIRFLIILANIIILCSTPFITPYLIPGYSAVVAALLIILLFGVYKLDLKFGKDAWTKSLVFCIVIAVIHGTLTSLFFFDEDGTAGFRNAIGMTMKYMFVLMAIPLIKQNYNQFHTLFWNIHIVIILLSVLLFFLCFVGVYLPYIEFSPDGREHYFFYIGSSNHMYEFGDRIFLRIAGYCDEPGRLALILTYLLVLNEYTFKKAILRILICFAGVLTFSAAFFITIVPIVYFWALNKIVNIKSIFVGIFIALLVSAVYIMNLDNETQENIGDAVEVMITNRFERGSDGKFHGDNRSEAISYQVEAFEQSPIIGVLGKGENYMIKQRIYTMTFFSGMARYGIFNLLLYLPFVLLLRKYWKTSQKWLFFSIGLNFLQRPELEHMFFLIVLTFIYYNQYFEDSGVSTSDSRHKGAYVKIEQ